MPISSKNMPGTNRCLREFLAFLIVSAIVVPTFGISFKRPSMLIFRLLYFWFVLILPKYFDMPPTFFAMDILLSLRTMIRFDFICSALLSASNAMPPERAPSPMTATTFSSPPRISLAFAIPSATEIDVELCPVLNVSAGFSLTFGNPLMPSSLRSVRNSRFRPVSSLCTYAWCPTSQISLSFGKSKNRCSAIVSSTAPRFEARCPPVRLTLPTSRLRSSHASLR